MDACGVLLEINIVVKNNYEESLASSIFTINSFCVFFTHHKTLLYLLLIRCIFLPKFLKRKKYFLN